MAADLTQTAKLVETVSADSGDVVMHGELTVEEHAEITNYTNRIDCCRVVNNYFTIFWDKLAEVC
jgi:hypothetical protein